MKEKNIVILLVIYYIGIILIAPKYGFYPDLRDTIRWTTVFLRDGIQNAYINHANYFPVTLYVYYIFGLITRFFHLDIARNIFLSKAINFLFDIGSFYLIFHIIKKFQISILKIFFVIYNIALIYNSIYWGQFDSVYTFFGFAAVYFALTKKPVVSLLCLLCSLNSKPQAVMFVPFVAILVTPLLWKSKTELKKVFLYGFLLELVTFLPFILYGKLDGYFDVIRKSTTYFPNLSKNAFNIWILLVGFNKRIMSDTLVPFLFSYRTWGFLLFGCAYLLALMPLLLSLKKSILLNSKKNNKALLKADTIMKWQIIYLSICLGCLVFFFFNTQMHERYANPAIFFASVFALLSNNVRSYIFYFLMSLAYLANMTYLFNALPFNLNAFLSPEFIAKLYGIVLLYGFIQLYVLYRQPSYTN